MTESLAQKSLTQFWIGDFQTNGNVPSDEINQQFIFIG
jgi:hypothetical protein